MAVPRLCDKLPHAERVTALTALGTDRLASGAGDFAIRIWNLADGAELGSMAGHLQTINTLVTLPNGRLASGSADRSIRIWDTEAFQMVGKLDGHKNGVTQMCLLWRDEGAWLLCSLSSDGITRVWDVEARVEVLCLSEKASGKVTSLASPLQNRLALGTAEGAIEVWDPAQPLAAEPAPLEKLEGAHSKGVTVMAALPSGILVTGSLDFDVKMWDITNLKGVLWIGQGHIAPVTALAVLPSGRFVSSSTEGRVKLWDMPRKGAVATLFVAPGTSIVSLAACSVPSGRLAIAVSGDPDAHVWDIGEGVHKEIGVFYGHEIHVTALQALPGGRLASGDANGVVRIWDTASVANPMHQRFELAAVQGPRVPVEDIACLPDGGILIAWKDATLKVFDDELNFVSDPPDRVVHTLAVLADQRMASGGPEDHAVTIWPLNGAGETFKMHGHADHVISLTELTDGHIASGGLDNLIKVWNVNARTCARTLAGHSEDVVALDMLRDGFLISAGYDKHIKVWDWQAGREIVDISAQNWGTGSCLTAMAATRSHLGGGWIATSRKEKSIRVWAHTGHGLDVARENAAGTAPALTDGKQAIADKTAGPAALEVTHLTA